ncbi:MAG TPA: hypothetical protein VH518_07470 [Tepidisphaeraceae bacterium]|jgi:hypothetical protein
MTQSNFDPAASRESKPAVIVTSRILTPFDRIRWGPVLAGLFAALSTLALLSVLGLAIGLSRWEPEASERRFSVAAGVWSVISALIAFYVGGYLSGRSAAAVGERNGMLNGGMVWAVAIPLVIFVVGGGMASIADMAVNGGGYRVVYLDRGYSTDVTDRAQTAAARIGETATGDTAGSTPRTPAIGGTTNTPTREDARIAARSAWFTLISLILGLCAASAGGLTGARSIVDDIEDDAGRRRRAASGDYGTTGTTSGT